MGLDGGEAGAAVGGGDGAEALHFEDGLEVFAGLVVVFDDEDGFHDVGGIGWSGWSGWSG